MSKRIVVTLLGIAAFAFIIAGNILYKIKEIAPLIYCPTYPFLGICAMLTGIILLVALVFKSHHSSVPWFDLVKSWLLVLAVFTFIWYLVTPAVTPLLHKVYRHEVRAEISKRIKGFFSWPAKKPDVNAEKK